MVSKGHYSKVFKHTKCAVDMNHDRGHEVLKASPTIALRFLQLQLQVEAKLSKKPRGVKGFAFIINSDPKPGLGHVRWRFLHPVLVMWSCLGLRCFGLPEGTW